MKADNCRFVKNIYPCAFLIASFLQSKNSFPPCDKKFLYGCTMRLAEESKNAIIASVCQYFSQAEKIILFGSRVDDSKRGGDIDILVQTPAASAIAFEAKLRTVAALQLKLGEQRIDLLTTTGTADNRLIVQNAYRQGVVLWKK